MGPLQFHSQTEHLIVFIHYFRRKKKSEGPIHLKNQKQNIIIFYYEQDLKIFFYKTLMSKREKLLF